MRPAASATACRSPSMSAITQPQRTSRSCRSSEKTTGQTVALNEVTVAIDAPETVPPALTVETLDDGIASPLEVNHVDAVERDPNMRRHPGNNQCDQVKWPRAIHANKLACLGLDKRAKVGHPARAIRVGVGAWEVDHQFLP